MATACGATGATPDLIAIERGSLVLDVDVSGTLESVESLRVGPPGVAGVWNYKIAMLAEEGKQVDKDAPILGFDTTELNNRLESKQAERDSASTQLQMKQAAARSAREDERLGMVEARAEMRKARLKADIPEALLSTIELDQSKIDLDLAKAKVAFLTKKGESAARRDNFDLGRWRTKRDRAERRVTELQASIGQMTVLAPRAGTVIQRANWQGDKKKVGDSTWRGETILRVVSLDQMEARGEIDEVDVSRVAVGRTVSLRLDAQADLELRGRVKEISRTVKRASPDNPVKVAVLLISLEDNPGVKLRPGMRFRGHVETDREDDVLLVPLEALEHTAQGPVAYRRSGGTEVVPVELGRRNDTFTVVLSGLEEGDELVPVAEVHR
ncbi:MAG: HlyD family efflux transporter periplasmic adaptor subunit [Nannocystaceae bacterium]|nr:HlyD family efflux transporter periplasmic adaptor subunit [Nannocystaceae bacterium]